MTTVRLFGPRDIRVEQLSRPERPGPRQVLLHVRAVGICGSDLRMYASGRIGDITLVGPLILGHEFAGLIEAVGDEALDGNGQLLEPGARVAVDPAQQCDRCELCRTGHPNLCPNHRFCGLWPTDGAMRRWMHVPARTCFPIPGQIDDAQAALLETLGVGIHTVDLAHIRVASSVAVIGAGPIGLCVLQVAKLAGADPVLVADRLPWRLALAEQLGALPINVRQTDAVAAVIKATSGRGVDVAIEAAWSDQSVQWAADMLRPGGRLVVVGIPDNDHLTLRHSTARRKGLTIAMCRRMRHAFPRAIALVGRGTVDLASMVSHSFALEQASEAFALNASYSDGVVKVILKV